jgi:hypothetical protein
MKKIIHFLIIVIFIYGFNMPSYAQDFNASGMAMGGAYGALARGVDAFTWNPANLALSYDNKLEINLVGINLNLANSALTIEEYERYFTESGHGGTWDEEEIKDLLALIPADGLQLSGDVNANVFGLLFGQYGFSVQMIGKSFGIIPKSIFELALKGNQKLFKEFSFNDTDGDGFSAIKLSLSLSHPIPFKKYFDEFGVGLNINYYRGIAIAEVQHFDGLFATIPDGLVSSMDMTYRTGQGGQGIGFDAGAAGRFNDKWSVSVGLNNLFAGINWKDETWKYRTSTFKDTIKIDDTEELDDVFRSDTLSTEPFKTDLPVVLHIGVAYDFFENLTFALDLEQAFENKMGYSDKGQLAIGVQYMPVNIVPLRAGMSFGGKWKYKMGLGFGLHLGFFHLDLAYAMHKALWPTKASGFSTAANIKFAF